MRLAARLPVGHATSSARGNAFNPQVATWTGNHGPAEEIWR